MELVKCAIVENDTVVNIIVVESLERAIEIFGGEIILVGSNGPEIGATRDTWEVEITEEPVEETPEEPTE